MTRQELDNLIFASGIIHSIQTTEERYGVKSALQQVYDILAMIIKDNSEYLKNYEHKVEVKKEHSMEELQEIFAELRKNKTYTQSESEEDENPAYEIRPIDPRTYHIGD